MATGRRRGQDHRKVRVHSNSNLCIFWIAVPQSIPTTAAIHGDGETQRPGPPEGSSAFQLQSLYFLDCSTAIHGLQISKGYDKTHAASRARKTWAQVRGFLNCCSRSPWRSVKISSSPRGQDGSQSARQSANARLAFCTCRKWG